jgi:hypothetical protein
MIKKYFKYIIQVNIINVFSIIWIGNLTNLHRFESCINICEIILNFTLSKIN